MVGRTSMRDSVGLPKNRRAVDPGVRIVGGKKGEEWLDAITRELATRQLADGSWPEESMDGLDHRDSRILNTAWALQIVLIHRGFLPLHER
jgi:hypothetical protein